MEQKVEIQREEKIVTRNQAREILLDELGWRRKTVSTLLDSPPYLKEIAAGPYLLKFE